jgi:DNA-binding transcriptional LysR family regulator
MQAPNFRTLDLNLLRVFDEVMSERNLTRAANNLALTQPAVSNALKRLRDALGDELLQRQGYGVEPTPAALTIWPAVREALAHLQVALGSVPFDAAHTSASFVLSMADATAAMLMPPLVQIIAQEAPQVQLRVVPLTTRDPRKLLDAGDTDVAVGHFPALAAAKRPRALSICACMTASTKWSCEKAIPWRARTYRWKLTAKRNTCW